MDFSSSYLNELLKPTWCCFGILSTYNLPVPEEISCPLGRIPYEDFQVFPTFLLSPAPQEFLFSFCLLTTKKPKKLRYNHSNLPPSFSILIWSLITHSDSSAAPSSNSSRYQQLQAIHSPCLQSSLHNLRLLHCCQRGHFTTACPLTFNSQSLVHLHFSPLFLRFHLCLTGFIGHPFH